MHRKKLELGCPPPFTMLTIRHFLSCALLLALVPLAGCEMFSADAWNRPSPLSGRPPPPEEKHENQGGFAVLVGAPDQPTAPRVMADIAAFAQARGFVRQSANAPTPDAPQRYVLGDIKLDVVYRTVDLRVVASLHSFSSKLNRKFVNQFYQDFRQEYGGHYGIETPLFENEEMDNPGGPSRDGSSRGGQGRGGH